MPCLPFTLCILKNVEEGPPRMDKNFIKGQLGRGAQ